MRIGGGGAAPNAPADGRGGVSAGDALPSRPASPNGRAGLATVKERACADGAAAAPLNGVPLNEETGGL